MGRDPTVSHRHHTLRAAVDWSHEALSGAQQRLFRRVAVFAGGFNMDAAERVCVPSSDNLDVLEGLAALVDKSLVVADRTELTTRYRLLETLRQYGAARLSAAGEESEIHARHHGDGYSKLRSEARAHIGEACSKHEPFANGVDET